MLGNTITQQYSKFTERQEFYLYSDLSLTCSLPSRYKFVRNLRSWMQMMKKCVPLEGLTNLLPNTLINLCSARVVRAVTYIGC